MTDQKMPKSRSKPRRVGPTARNARKAPERTAIDIATIAHNPLPWTARPAPNQPGALLILDANGQAIALANASVSTPETVTAQDGRPAVAQRVDEQATIRAVATAALLASAGDLLNQHRRLIAAADVYAAGRKTVTAASTFTAAIRAAKEHADKLPVTAFSTGSAK